MGRTDNPGKIDIRRSAGNHYDFLGLEVTASVREIRQALDVVALEADALVHISPERSFHLWERIREIRHDLLEDRKRRQAYDTQVLATQHAPAEEPHLYELEPHVRRALLQARPPQLPQPPPKAAGPPAQPVERRRRPFAYLVGVAGALAVAAALVVAVLLQPKGQPVQHPVALAPGGLSEHPASKTGGSSAGRTVHLSWSPVRGASRYRVQIASGTGQVGAAIFTHPLVVAKTGRTSYTLRATPNRLYAWRVQVDVRGHWTPYSPGHYFFVTAPRIHHRAPHHRAVRPPNAHPRLAARPGSSPQESTRRRTRHAAPRLAAALPQPTTQSSAPHTGAGGQLAAGPTQGITTTHSDRGPRPARRRTTTSPRPAATSPPYRPPRVSPPNPPTSSPPATPQPTSAPNTGPTHPFGLSAPPGRKGQAPSSTPIPPTSTGSSAKAQPPASPHPFGP